MLARVHITDWPEEPTRREVTLTGDESIDLHADSYGNPIEVAVDVDLDDDSYRLEALAWDDGEIELVHGTRCGERLSFDELAEVATWPAVGEAVRAEAGKNRSAT